ncbi:Lsr2 family DNA-binding protein [Gordonia rhizosphera]|uniref:Lsr2 DNA-binding domain-containing protein n=1 Tax=Gordonia rhizosphera NBRC 16068 TaxID=1108045 RepID=K6W359_9ACTN|nr:histone-like nucleoid-structuring protein Lsr2 [Gordonia rhizosphera]GAB88156.1 hypothetical protein GORHZ_006_00250 [Gordonia rhizosphera NBRC 16068]
MHFGIGDTTYEFDTTPQRAAFRTDLLTYLEVSRSVPYSHATPPKTTRVPAAGSGPTSTEQKRAIRDWARTNGFRVSDRGCIPGDIVEAFEAAHNSA